MSFFEPGSVIGRYTLLGKLATGGMSEIYIARQAGPSGFTKVVVIKVILPHLAADPQFMRMFTNEARLAALLNHPNVVQIFDYGEEHDRHYMAMEYIDGRNLNRIARKLHKQGEAFPRVMLLRIISDTCSALDYAHTLTDSAGTPLHIIHRDISRENLLVTYTGQVKLVDFGIARAAILESSTAAGTLKGKYGYMAPELIRGEDPDCRVDIYGLGVVLYALLLGRMPLQAKNQANLLNMILNQEPPRPRVVDVTIPESLEAIVLRAMHKDRDRRYQSAAELRHELEAYLLEHETAVLPYHLAEFMTSAFPPGSDEDRETYKSLTTTTPAGSRVDSGFRPTPTSSTVPAGEAVVATPAPQRRGRLLLSLSALLLVCTGLTLAYLYLISTQPRIPVAATVPTTAPTLTADLAPPTDVVVARAALPDAAAAQPPDGRPSRVHAPASPPPGRRRVPRGLLSVTAPGPGEVLLGKRRLGPLPLAGQSLRIGRHSLTVRSRKLGYAISHKVQITTGAHLRLRLQPRKGTIRILVHPWARVTLDGRLLGITPLDPIAVYQGPHVLVFRNSDLKQARTRRVLVQPGKVALVKVVFE